MHASDHPSSSSAATEPAAESMQSRYLGGRARLSVSWAWQDSQSVKVQLQALSTTPAYLIHVCELSMNARPACRFRMPAQIIGPQERNVEFQLGFDAEDRMQLRADIPIDSNTWFNDVLSTWSDPTDPDRPVDPDGPDEADSPSWSPFYDPDQAFGFNIANARNRYRIFDFLWLRGIKPAPVDNPRFIQTTHVPQATAYPLLSALATDLEKAATPSEAWTAMRKTAANYIEPAGKAKGETAYPYVKSLADLDQQWRSFIRLQQRLLQVQGEASLEELDAIVAKEASTPSQLIDNKTFSTQWVRVWQSLVALVLTSGKLDFADTLGDVLRVAVFVFDLHARDASLSRQDARQARLEGVTVIPACAVPPAEALPAPKDGSVRVLGVGELQVIYKECERYALGPLSRTFSVLQGERRRLRTREESVEIERIDETSGQTSVATTNEGLAHTSDLEGALRATIESGCHERDFDKLDIVYNDIYMPQSVSGSWGDTLADGVRDQAQVSRLAQEITRQATRRIANSVQHARSTVHAQRRQHTVDRDIDNRDAAAHLNGLYRWLIRRSRLALQDEGRRLVIECLVASPAASFATQVDQPVGVAIAPPPTLAELKIHAPSDIDAGNYLELAGIYGIENLSAAPEQYRQFIARLSGQAAQASGVICLPEGFVPSAGPTTSSTASTSAITATLSYVISDKSQALVCIVGNHVSSYGGSTTTAATTTKALVQDAPAASSGCTMIDPFKQQPMPPPVPGADTDNTVTLDPKASEIPLLAYSDAQSYAITVTMLGEDSRYDERLQRWQQTCYAQLLDACLEQRQQYDLARAQRIRQCLQGSERAMLVAELKRQALSMLSALYCAPAGTPATAPASMWTTLDETFQWRQMAYAFHPWSVGQPSTEATLHWRGLDIATHPDDALLEAFLAAGSARVLIPVTPGYELALLYFFGYGSPWRSGSGNAPLPARWLDAASELAQPRSPGRRCWWIEEPTALEVLQQGDQLPRVDLQPGGFRPGETESLTEPMP